MSHEPNYAAKGESGIFAFPFRILATEGLKDHVIEAGDYKYRIHVPFLMRPEGSPVTDDVPARLWSDFRWHPSVGSEKRRFIRQLTIKMNNAIFFDGVRLDVWGNKANERIQPYMQTAMRWLRWDSMQPWIGDVDRHVEHTLKRVFPIAGDGRAVGEVSPVGEMLVIVIWRLVTDKMWRSAFERAAGGSEVPVYWNLFYDSMNARAVADYPRSIMNLAMAIESCRDQNISRVHPAKFAQGRGPKLESPFDHTDLLQHLSKNTQEVFGRDFSREHPEHWPHLCNLYKARHHVAHGSGAVYPTPSGLTPVDSKTHEAWEAAARAALVWLERL
jgi:hypothetical protein